MLNNSKICVKGINYKDILILTKLKSETNFVLKKEQNK